MWIEQSKYATLKPYKSLFLYLEYFPFYKQDTNCWGKKSEKNYAKRRLCLNIDANTSDDSLYSILEIANCALLEFSILAYLPWNADSVSTFSSIIPIVSLSLVLISCHMFFFFFIFTLIWTLILLSYNRKKKNQKQKRNISNINFLDGRKPT